MMELLALLTACFCMRLSLKVAARNLFRPSLEYLAARDHMMHVVYSFLQPTRLLDMYADALLRITYVVEPHVCVNHLVLFVL